MKNTFTFALFACLLMSSAMGMEQKRRRLNDPHLLPRRLTKLLRQVEPGCYCTAQQLKYKLDTGELTTPEQISDEIGHFAYLSVITNDPDSLRLMLESGADPNAKLPYGCHLLTRATEDTPCARVLLKHGADIETPAEWTPLMEAAKRGNPESIRLLLDRRRRLSAWIEAGLDGQRPLTIAAQHAHEWCMWTNGRTSTLRILLAAGAQMTPESDRWRPCHH